MNDIFDWIKENPKYDIMIESVFGCIKISLIRGKERLDRFIPHYEMEYIMQILNEMDSMFKKHDGLVKVVIAGEAKYMTQEEADKLEEEFSKFTRHYPHTENTRKLYEEA